MTKTRERNEIDINVIIWCYEWGPYVSGGEIVIHRTIFMRSIPIDLPGRVE